MNDYTFFAPPQIVFGWGRRAELPKLVPHWGRRVLVLTGSRSLERCGLLDSLWDGLRSAGRTVDFHAAPAHEPEVADVDQLVARWKALDATVGDCVLAIGGGSTIDLAKAAAALITQPQQTSVIDYLEGVGRGLTLTTDPLPVIAVPTTAGTGTEATKNAVISSYDPPFKKSLRSDRMIPRVVLVDPELTCSLPPTTTAYTGMDAITQLLESYLSRRAAPIPQALCVQGLQLALPALPLAFRDGQHREARTAMAHAALLSGMALANSGLGLAHGVAAALGVHAKVPHGLACAVMLPAALPVNRSVRLSELAELSRLVLKCTASTTEAAADRLIETVVDLCREIAIPARLREIGVTRELLPALVPGSRGNSMSGNPRDLSDAELLELLETLW
ncbi:MAG: iron-containing alcohol dehydrogenase [Planctomycetaceae bacterium]|nr:iron-containing alcohol dehydrogenase [Planctomycetaceae bacterium]